MVHPLLLLTLYYTSYINLAYISIYIIIREIYIGYSIRYFHSNGPSLIFILLFIHILRSLFYGSYFYNTNTWFTGIIIYLLLMAIAFIGYVLPFAQMSLWGATVITNLLSFIPSLIEFILGGFSICNPIHILYNLT